MTCTVCCSRIHNVTRQLTQITMYDSQDIPKELVRTQFQMEPETLPDIPQIIKYLTEPTTEWTEIKVEHHPSACARASSSFLQEEQPIFQELTCPIYYPHSHQQEGFDPAYLPETEHGSEGSDADDDASVMLEYNDCVNCSHYFCQKCLQQNYTCCACNASRSYYTDNKLSPTQINEDSNDSLEKKLPSIEIFRGANEVCKPHSESMCHASFTETGKRKRGAKNILLWKFLLTELSSPNTGSTIKWINKAEGTFRFMDTVEVSRKWGQKKQKADMNFEKLSRGIRHYYKNNFMKRIDGVRLVYKFNWQKIPQEWRPYEQTNRY